MRNLRLRRSYLAVCLSTLSQVLLGCGRESYSGSQGSSPEQDSAPASYYAATMASLPICNESRNGALAYVRDSKKFFVCNSNSWIAEIVEIQSGNQIAGRWKFHVDSYVGETDIMSEDSYASAKIGDIEVVKYTNGLASYSVSGIMQEDTSTPVENVTEHTHIYADQFSFSGIISDTTREYSKIFKISTFQNTRLRIKIDFSGARPTFKAVVDVDGNFSDNSDTSYVLAAE